MHKNHVVHNIFLPTRAQHQRMQCTDVCKARVYFCKNVFMQMICMLCMKYAFYLPQHSVSAGRAQMSARRVYSLSTGFAAVSLSSCAVHQTKRQNYRQTKHTKQGNKQKCSKQTNKGFPAMVHFRHCFCSYDSTMRSILKGTFNRHTNIQAEN